MTEAPMPPVLRSTGVRLVLQKSPRQPQPHWAEMVQPLPGQILRPLRDARDARRSIFNRRARLNHARQQLRIYTGNLREWFDSIDSMMDRRGMEYVDPSNPLQADAFLARLGDSGRKALEKRQRIGAAIAYAEMAIEWLEWELAHGN